MDNIQDVNGTSSPVVSEDIKTPEVVEAPVTVSSDVQPKGSKTPDSNLYAALEEERKLRKDAEQKVKEAEEKLSETNQDIFSDEGKTLQKKISSLESTLTSMLEARELDDVKSQYPAIKDKWEDFDKFRTDYPRHKLDNVAKIFLAENGLLDEVPTRKGLERTVAGPKSPPSTGMTTEDVSNLRKNNYKKYLELITSGKLNPNEIK